MHPQQVHAKLCTEIEAMPAAYPRVCVIAIALNTDEEIREK